MPVIYLHPDPKLIEELREFLAPNQEKMEALSLFVRNQVLLRFRTQGASGGAPWAEKRLKQLGYDDGRSILTGPGAGLKESFQNSATGNSATVWSDHPAARVHQLGTAKYGGPIPTIKPVKAKALFIAISDRARSAETHTGPAAARYRAAIGKIEPAQASMSAIKIPTRGRKVSRGGTMYFAPLVRGRIKDGRLEKWDEKRQEFIPGVPDFVFLMKVDIVPRPMLPDSEKEQQDQMEFFADIENEIPG